MSFLNSELDRKPSLQDVADTMTIPELQWLGKIINAGDKGRIHCFTWCEDRLWNKGLTYKWKVEFKYMDVFLYTATPLGIQVYEHKRQQYIDRKQKKKE